MFILGFTKKREGCNKLSHWPELDFILTEYYSTKKEWKKRTRKTIGLCEKLGDFINLVNPGKIAEKELKEEEINIERASVLSDYVPYGNVSNASTVAGNLITFPTTPMTPGSLAGYSIPVASIRVCSNCSFCYPDSGGGLVACPKCGSFGHQI